MDASFIFLMVIALVSFFLLTAMLLVPIYLFLKREKRASEQWTPEALAQRVSEPSSSPKASQQHDPTSEEKPGT